MKDWILEAVAIAILLAVSALCLSDRAGGEEEGPAPACEPTGRALLLPSGPRVELTCGPLIRAYVRPEAGAGMPSGCEFRRAFGPSESVRGYSCDGGAYLLDARPESELQRLMRGRKEKEA